MKGPTHKAFAGAVTTAIVAAPVITENINNPLVTQIRSTLSQCLPIDPNNHSSYAIMATLIIIIAYFTARLPDWDELLKQYRIPIKLKHRPLISHSIYPLIPMVILLFLFKNTFFHVILLGVLCGYTSHLIGDAYGARGIDWFLTRGEKIYYKNNNPQNGISAVIVKGNRLFFPRLYKTGQKFLGFIPAHHIWQLLFILELGFFYYYLFK